MQINTLKTYLDGLVIDAGTDDLPVIIRHETGDASDITAVTLEYDVSGAPFVTLDL